MILAMSKHLDLHIVAEGVETREQLEFLAERKCQSYQGYLFSKPVEIDRFLELMQKHSDLHGKQLTI
jgi:EAL domain-containing protein (putative c-di-GMP-specific phosphodiesterase class I)